MLIPNFLRRARWFLIAAAAVLLLYAVLGFLVAPALLRAKLPPQLSARLGRPVRVARVRVNPFALSVTVDGFAIQEPDGRPFLGWQRLYLNLRLSTLLGREVAFNAIQLTGPYASVVLDPGGRMNFSDILARLDGPSPAPAAAPRVIRIDHLDIQAGRITLLDRTLAEPFATTLGPLSLDLTGFSTAVDRQAPYACSGRTQAGEAFAWSGEFTSQPLASRGRLTLTGLALARYQPFLDDRVAFQVRDGRLSVQAQYDFQWSPAGHVLRIGAGALQLRQLQLGRGKGGPELELPQVDLGGLEADLVARTVRVDSLWLQGGRAQLTRAADGQLSLATLLTPRPDRHPDPEPPAPIRFNLRELGLRGFQLGFEDRVPARPVQARIQDLDLTLHDLSLDRDARMPLDLSLTLNGAGKLKVQGQVAPFRRTADLAVKVDHLALPAFDPYLDGPVALRLTRGGLGLEGRLQGGFPDRLSFQGNLRLDRIEAADAERLEPFLGFRALVLTGLELRMAPQSVAIRQVDMLGPEPSLVLAADGSSNIGRALKLEAPAGKPGSAVGQALPPSPPGPPMPLSILRSRVKDGKLSFTDRSLEPNAALLITSLEGTATSLSSAPDTPSILDFTGLAGGLAPLRIQGRAMPLRKDQDTDVSLTIQASELSDFTPYTLKFLGYPVHKGKLSLDSRVTIRKRQLEAMARLRLDQFFLGDKVPSPDAVHLPVKLALAVLRDRHGVIDMELPVTGNLDDPDLHYGKIVWHALLNVLGKVATSPFALLAKLGGSQDHDLSFVGFEPGSAAPDADALNKLQGLARALQERPGLGLEADGGFDPVADAAALRKQALERQLLALVASPGPLAGAEREHGLQLAFEQRFKPVKGTPWPPAAAMEQQLLGAQAVTDDDLRRLADQRVKALFQMLRDAQVDPGRLFQVEGHEPGSRVKFGLRP
jgi:uncharacterized protein involved in outer membrane biogenesis